MDESELIHKIKNIQLKAKHLVTEILSGEYESAFKGQGIEFSEVREYTPGDDIRLIDWNVTARMNIPFIKEFHEERELTLMIMVDLSSSQEFGSTQQFKHELATELSAVLTYLAIRNNDKVGLIVFTDKVEKYIPPKKGRINIWKIIREIFSFTPEGKKTDINNALEFLMKVTKRKAIVFLISDFIDEGYSKNINIVAKKHDLVAVRIKDKRENSFPEVGFVELEDAETGEFILVDTYDKNFRKRLNFLKHRENEKLKSFFNKNRIDVLEIETNKPYIKDLIKFFSGRIKHQK